MSNLISFIVKIKNNCIDTEFKYLFTSLSRSFILEKNDEEIFDVFRNNSFKETDLYRDCLEIARELDYSSISSVLEIIVDKFKIYDNYIKIGNIHSGIVKLSKLREMALNLEELGYDVERFSNYLKELLEVGIKIEYT